MGDGGRKSNARIRVHDPVLYTQLMNAADWSHMIENEGKQMQESLARREAEAALARQREQVKLEAARNRLEQAVATRRRRHLADEQQKHQIQEFRDRMNAVGRRHTELVSMCAAAQRREVFRTHRALLRLSRQREEEVLRPIQDSIDAQLADAEGARKRSDMREAMMQAYISECNRLEKTALGGVCRDIIDPVYYNPIVQRKLCTIRYPEPPPPKTVVENHRLEANKAVEQYEQLALEYRKLERESMTGVLSAPSRGVGSPYTLTQCVLPSGGAVDTPQHTQGNYLSGPKPSCLPALVELQAPLSQTYTVGLDCASSELERLKTLSTLARNRGSGVAATCVVGKGGQSHEVMPPLGAGAEENDQLMRWMSRRLRFMQSRFRDLPVTKWDRFTETALGWNTASDGSAKGCCTRRKNAAYYRQLSSVELAHLPHARSVCKPTCDATERTAELLHDCTRCT